MNPENSNATVESRSTLKFCACCPAPCRSAIPSSDARHGEMQTPSSLALIALALLDGQLQLDEGVERSLRDTVAARHAVRACTYGYDIVALIESLLEGPSRTALPQARAVAAHG